MGKVVGKKRKSSESQEKSSKKVVGKWLKKVAEKNGKVEEK